MSSETGGVESSGWRVDGPDGRWVAWADGQWDADPTTVHDIQFAGMSGHTVLLTPTGPSYRIPRPLDETGVYVAATQVALPGGAVTGDPPDLPIPSEPGVVY